MDIFDSYVKLPEGTASAGSLGRSLAVSWPWPWIPMDQTQCWKPDVSENWVPPNPHLNKRIYIYINVIYVCIYIYIYVYIYIYIWARSPDPQTPQWYPPPTPNPPTPPKPSICMLFAHIHTHIHIYTPLSTPPPSHLYVICSTWEPRPRQRTLSTCIFLS